MQHQIKWEELVYVLRAPCLSSMTWFAQGRFFADSVFASELNWRWETREQEWPNWRQNIHKPPLRTHLLEL